MRCPDCHVSMDLQVRVTAEKIWKCPLCREFRTKEPKPVRKEEDASLVLALGEE
jgi:ribosomal protein L37AE/L43A